MATIKISENAEGALEELLGQTITVFCCRYIYTGKLVAIYDDTILLDDSGIVYETGAFDTKDWERMEKLPHNKWYVSKQSIESYGILK